MRKIQSGSEKCGESLDVLELWNAFLEVLDREAKKAMKQ